MEDSIPQKCCGRCRMTKPLEDFYKLGVKGGRQGGYHHICKECSSQKSRQDFRKFYLPRNYRITEAEYKAMLEAQGGVCAVCGNPEVTVSRKKGTPRALAVDHDHKTGKVRALLCSPCNQALGLMTESPERISGLLRYIEKWNTGK